MEILNKPGIYRLVFPDGSYVGQSANVKSRLKQHFSKIGDEIHPNHLIREGCKIHGWPNAEVLEYCSLVELNAAEIHWMDKFDCYPNGYNLKPGGDYPRAEEKVLQQEIVISSQQEIDVAMMIFMVPLLIGILFCFIHLGLGLIAWFITAFILYCRTY